MLINKTKSVSPISYKEIDAEVILEDEKVYLLKQDEEGNMYKSLIEKDHGFYRFMTIENVVTQVPPANVMAYVSDDCQLSCPVCYEVKKGKAVSLSELEEMLKDFKGKSICLCGKEPTCRDDITEVIKLVNRKNQSWLLTNGIKLAEETFVKKLKDGKISGIVFSFDGFRDDIYDKIDGQPLLKLKLAALDNIKKYNIDTVLSATICRGINSDQIKELSEFCWNNRRYISQLRIRTLTSVGKHLDSDPYCPSELLDLILKDFDIKREDVLNELAFWRIVFKVLKFIPETVKTYNMPKLCSFFFHLKKEKKVFAIGEKIDIERIKNSKFKLFWIIYYFFRAYGIRHIFERFAVALGWPRFMFNSSILPVTVRCWPNIYNIDLEENKKCTSQYYKNGIFYPFCYYNIIESRSSQEI